MVSGILLQGMTEEKFKAELGSFRLWLTNSLESACATSKGSN